MTVMDMEAKRRESLQTAMDLGYSTNPNLPLLDDDDFLRTGDEIVRRMLVLHAVVATSYGFPVARSLGWLQSNGLSGEVTAGERGFLDASDPARKAFHQWQVEAICALSWALGLHGQLDFSGPCPDDLVHLLPDLKRDESVESLQARVALRPREEIVRAADLAYCLHWSVRDSEIKGAKIPGAVEPGVIRERRRALDWMLAPDAWDEIALDT